MKEPIEWKSPQWWRNRPLNDRLEFIRAPKRLRQENTDSYGISNWEPGDSLVFMGKTGRGKSVKALSAARKLVMDHKVRRTLR